MKKAIYFDPTDGKIIGHTLSDDPKAPDGFALVEVPLWVDLYAISGFDHKIDLKSRTVIERTPEEKSSARLPTRRDVDAYIFAELMQSDKTQLADYPIVDKARALWAAYRQGLRDLSKLGDPVAMIREWPQRPDGNNPVEQLRARIQ